MANRTALVTAGALTIIAIAAIAAVAANIGLLRLTGGTGPVGWLGPGDLASTAVVEQPAATTGTGPAGGQGSQDATQRPGRPSDQRLARQDDSRFGDRRRAPDEHRAEQHFQGRQDDD